MDPIKILKRSWQILWSYRALWVFGLILALAGAGSSGGGGNNGYQYNRNDPPQFNQDWHPEDMPQSLQEVFDEMRVLFREGITQATGISQQELNALIWLAVAAIVFFFVLGIVTAIARYVAETATMRMVDEYENSGAKMTVRQGFRIGWSRTSWRLFLINLIVNLPMILLMVVFIIVGVIVYQMVAGGETGSMASIISLIGVVFLSIFAAIILSIILGLLRHFFWRACALEGLGVRDSLVRGFAMVRENWKSVGLMWLVMIGLGIAWALVSIILAVVTLPVVAITVILGAVVAAIPGLVLAGLFSTFLGGYLPWVAAILFVMPLFFTLAFSPWLLLGAWQAVFTSTVWTLTYRELKAIPDAAPPQEIPAAS